MAERRMFAKTVIDSDAFLDMPLSAQALYFHLSMRADDDGFINNPKKIQRMIGASDDDGKLLTMKRFIIPFESGVVVIKHWKIHNYIQKDRYKETMYKEEKAMLEVKENRAYSLPKNECIQSVYNSDTQVSIGKYSIGKLSINNNTPIPDGKVRVSSSQIEEEFNELWKLYPNKKGKTNALKSYMKVRKKDTTFEQVREGIVAYNFFIQKTGLDMRYVKHGSTWFNQQCWNDDYTVTERKANAPVRKNSDVYTLSNGVETSNPFVAILDEMRDEDD